ncbi:MAG: rhomboid family intramembrane serine protease [Myxococcota bacterium]|nr:rhomboid family intramembrane serine protease [Myxococcota bacterium]
MIPTVLPLRDHLATRTIPFVNYALVAANVVVFALELDAMAAGAPGEGFEREWGLVPLRLLQDPSAGIPTIFTSMFMHASLSHLGFNMLFLWIFGDNVEDAMGHLRYLAFYIAGGICAASAQVLAGPMSTLPMVGASGAIAAVLAAYVFLYPRSSITVLNPVPILWLFWGLFMYFPAWLVIGLWFLAQLWDALTNTAQGGVAFMAHVGGFIGGALLWRLFLAGRERMDGYAHWQQWAQRRAGRNGWT